METGYPLSEEQIASYQRNGYIQLLDVLSKDDLADARAAVARVLDHALDRGHDLSGQNAEYDKVFVQKINLWQVDEGIRRHTFSPKLAEIARRLTRASHVRLWHDQVLVKNPGDSKPSPWHQDFPYWPIREIGGLSCWMALDDVDEANGCMAFVPGSHWYGVLEPIRLTDPQDLFGLVPKDSPVGAEFKPIFQPMPAGSCTFHNALTFHYAGPNTTDRPRRALVTIYMPGDVHFTGEQHAITRDLDLQKGDVLAGDRFPILSRAEAPVGKASAALVG
jgi:ectoine hydroxylase-related dioxygenase (phytanoyl-CoA dioxygenase family)